MGHMGYEPSGIFQKFSVTEGEAKTTRHKMTVET